MTASKLAGLIDVFQDVIHALRFDNEEDFIAEMEDMLAQLRSGSMPNKLKMKVIFAPTGPLQEASISSGWADEYLRLAGRFDVELAQAFA
ncbi:MULTISPECIES: hypothetical protein [unclassified Mesorhizobium]|uniref:hypothetical protein n=1 Tax=unclassified Mesorhizobium TaxID=325217 RepID=UPI0030142B77